MIYGKGCGLWTELNPIQLCMYHEQGSDLHLNIERWHQPHRRKHEIFNDEYLDRLVHDSL